MGENEKYCCNDAIKGKLILATHLGSPVEFKLVLACKKITKRISNMKIRFIIPIDILEITLELNLFDINPAIKLPTKEAIRIENREYS
ncbi:MAG: hypothetical protein KGI06_04915 [Candidatus Micrarchaeota archaeon]|nr:hypothetical protein [Candidatus Micrarchaeota archaeon]